MINLRRSLFKVSRLALTQACKIKFNPVYRPIFYFSSAPETFQFQAETKKLLHIVAKSLYTDKDVFIRELLSNAADALEKQRFLSSQKGEALKDDLEIKIELDENKRTITIEDTGVGMTKQEMIENLGTIAKSGSKQFLEKIQQEGNDSSVADKIIGQFGVGFYSAFIVGDTVEVVSRSDTEKKTYLWVSDGSGQFSIQEQTDNSMLYRGTRITIFLKPEQAEFSKKSTVETTIQRYSNFISFPILLNNERLNLVSAIWARNKSEITPEEYNKFFEYIAKTKAAYRYKIHYSTEAPISIKALLYIPQTHMEKFGMEQEEFNVHLYSRKILIKRQCREILPNYLRFVKGVIDCEDLPLNISRENYQDSSLIVKLRSILTRKILSELESEANKDSSTYLKWYQDFQFFLKEGVASDHDNQEQIMRLLRYQSNKSEDFCSLDEYVSKLPAGTNSIYFLLAPSRQHALASPYMEPFRDQDIPIIFVYMHIDEMVFKGVQKYQNFIFVNIETNQDELAKTFQEVQHDSSKGLPQDEVTPFCLWLKNELSPMITQVQVSKRLKDSPAIVISPLSSGMRQVMSMIDRQQQANYNTNLTLEINPNHKIMSSLNQVRKSNSNIASMVAKQIVDNCMLTAGLIQDPKGMVDRINQIISVLIDKQINAPKSQIEETTIKVEREKVQQQTEKETEKQSTATEGEAEIEIGEDGTPRVVQKKK